MKNEKFAYLIIFLYLCGKLDTMRTRTLLFTILLAVGLCSAQVTISVGDPETWTAQELASYVGQTIVFDAPIVVCSNAGSNLTVAPWRMFQPQCQGAQGTAEYNLAAHINSSCWFSLAGVSGYHRCGEKIYHLKAKVNSATSLTWVSGEWHGNTRADLEKGLPDLGDYRLLICSFNLENYFVDHLGKNYLGANSYAAHQAQRAKVSKALKKINADIFGLVELEEGNSAIQEIVNDLNSNLPGRNYKFFSDASSGSSQKSDYVYDANVVEPIGSPSEINTELVNRKKMLCFREKATGEKFIFSINHFKAMNTGDEYRRVNEARAVLDYYKTKYSPNPSIKDYDVLFMGDLNCYAKTEPIDVFMNGGMIDLHRAFHADSSYSYMFGGLASYIDHAICNETLYPQITGMAAYTINSDESDNYTYDKSSDATMFRCSDHDPVLVGLKLDSTLVYDPTPVLNSAEIIQGNANRLVIQNAHKAEQKSFYAIYTISGLLLQQGEITSVYHETSKPTTPGVYIVYVYFDGKVYQGKIVVR